MVILDIFDNLDLSQRLIKLHGSRCIFSLADKLFVQFQFRCAEVKGMVNADNFIFIGVKLVEFQF